MRKALMAASTLALLPIAAHASTPKISSVLPLHASVLAGGQEQLTVTARDLAGTPLRGATVSAVVKYGKTTNHLRFPVTNAGGQSVRTFHVPVGVSGRATVVISIVKGILEISAHTVFTVGAGKTSTPRPGATWTATTTPTPVVSTTLRLGVSARVLPVQAVAPQPVWIVVLVRSSKGLPVPRVSVSAVAHFVEGAATASAVSDDQGVATIRLDTGIVKRAERVSVEIFAAEGKARGTTSATFAVDRPATSTPTSTATATPTPTPAPIPTWTTVPTWTPLPTSTSTPPPLPTATSAFAPVTVPTATFTPLPYPTFTPVPTATATWTPVSLPTWTPVPLPTWTTVPVATATFTPVVATGCPGSASGCMTSTVNLLNSFRAAVGIGPLTLSETQSNGTGSCVGSYGHSYAMAQTGNIWHINPDYPAASFSADICIAANTAGENVGQMTTGDEWHDITTMVNAMMSESPNTPAGCAAIAPSTNHACNIISPYFTKVGVGLYTSGSGTTWFTNDFVG